MIVSNIKTWWKVAKPKTGLFVWQIIISILEKMAFVSVALPSAKIISCISVIDYKGAKTNVIIVVVLVFFYCLFASINSRLALIQSKYISYNCESLGLNKILTSTTTPTLAKQKIITIMNHNLTALTTFSAELSATFGFLAQLIFILCLLFVSNMILGLIVLGISLFCLLLYNLIAFFEERATRNEQSTRDDKTSMLADIIDGKDFAHDLNLEGELSKSYLSKSEILVKTTSKANHLKNARELWLYFIWNILVALTTLYMINLLRLDFLTLTLFLLCLPYLNEALERTMNCYLIWHKSRLAKGSANRISTLLSLSAPDLIVFGNNISNNLLGDLIFTNVSLHKGSIAILSHLSFGLNKGEIANFIFDNETSKIAFCNLLRRIEKPTIGTITLDSINIYDFSKQIYIHNLTTIKSEPFFFQNTIYENLKIANASRNQIYIALKQLKIYEQVVELPQGVNTQISEIALNNFLLYELSLARALLTKAEILLFQDIPTALSPKELNKLNDHLLLLSKNHTIIIATDYEPATISTKKFAIKKDGRLHPIKNSQLLK